MKIGAGLILDIIFLCIFIFFVYRSARRGFIRTVVELVGWVLVLLIAVNISTPIAEGIYDSFFSQTVESYAENTAATIIQNMSDNVSKSDNGFVLWILSIVTENMDPNEYLSGVGFRAIAVSFLHWILVALIFTVGLIVVRILASFLTRLFGFSIFKTANRLLGGACGALKALILIFIVALILTQITAISPNGSGGVINSEMVDTSFVCNYISNLQFSLTDWR